MMLCSLVLRATEWVRIRERGGCGSPPGATTGARESYSERARRAIVSFRLHLWRDFLMPDV